jgi:hypothetical protein
MHKDEDTYHVGDERDFFLRASHQPLFKPRNQLQHRTEYAVLPSFSEEACLEVARRKDENSLSSKCFFRLIS